MSRQGILYVKLFYRIVSYRRPIVSYNMR